MILGKLNQEVLSKFIICCILRRHFQSWIVKRLFDSLHYRRKWIAPILAPKRMGVP
jgi:hypothetical protein